MVVVPPNQGDKNETNARTLGEVEDLKDASGPGFASRSSADLGRRGGSSGKSFSKKGSSTSIGALGGAPLVPANSQTIIWQQISNQSTPDTGASK